MNIDRLDVFYHDIKVGTIAIHDRLYMAFQYDNDWLREGFSISPFSLPLEDRVFIPKLEPLDGMFGVFADSLPDGWGRLLVDRLMRKNGIDPNILSNLDRLAIVADSGMGALTYRPAMPIEYSDEVMSLDEIAESAKQLLETEYCEELDALYVKGGSSGGARPKILTEVEGEPWIIKFPSRDDSDNIGRLEYEYSLCAKECGIEMEETRLFESKICDGFFGTRRFDRDGSNKIHMITAAGLLETSHRIPNLDYNLLMNLTLQLTGDMAECKKLFRLMCFNVYAHNRDDHSKNFSYLYKDGRWGLSPAYDLTYSNSIGGEHATTVDGNGYNPGQEDILHVAKKIGINMKWAKKTETEIHEIINARLER